MSSAKNLPADREVAAISGILMALEGLDGESIQRVLDYVFNRLSIARSAGRPSYGTASAAPVAGLAPSSSTPSAHRQSIRDLKEEKQPESSNQMAALVAYYLSELAPPGERQEAISAGDLQKYFKQAGWKLPNAIDKTLQNAAAAGYFDPSARGMYKLNPVGYNLVVHGLPRTGVPEFRGPLRKKKKAPTKKKKAR